MKIVATALLIITAQSASADTCSQLFKGPFGIFKVVRKLTPAYKSVIEPGIRESQYKTQMRYASIFSQWSDYPRHQTPLNTANAPEGEFKGATPAPKSEIPKSLVSHDDTTASRIGFFIAQHLAYILQRVSLPTDSSGRELLKFIEELDILRPRDASKMRKASLILSRNFDKSDQSRLGIENFFSALSDIAMVAHRYASPNDAPLFVRPIPMHTIIPDTRTADFISFVPLEKNLQSIADHIPVWDRNELVRILQEELPLLDFEEPSDDILEQVSMERMAVAVLLIRAAQAGSAQTKAHAEAIIALKKTVNKVTGMEDNFFSPEASDFDLLIFDGVPRS